VQADFLFAGLNLNRIIQKIKSQNKANFVDDALKTRGIIYLNVDTRLLFATPIKISGYSLVPLLRASLNQFRARLSFRFSSYSC